MCNRKRIIWMCSSPYNQMERYLVYLVHNNFLMEIYLRCSSSFSELNSDQMDALDLCEIMI